MLSRRHFLGYGGLGTLAVAGGCHPPRIAAAAQEAGPVEPSLDRLARAKPLKDRLLGYPINMNTPPEGFFAWRRELARVGVGEFAFNNVGNPFQASPIPYNTHDFEREVIGRFGARLALPSGDLWGFVSHSGTDSNMHGMYLGRTVLKGRTKRLPKAYFTREAHYSVQILRDLLGLETVDVGTLPDGAMDVDDLARKLAANPDAPALVVATVGTTFKGAIDDVAAIRKTLSGRVHHLHVDAALFGGYLPFTSQADPVLYRAGQDDTSTGRYDSIAVSCHKFFGFPAPAGLFLTRRGLYEEFNALFSQIHNPEYIHHVPGTITCSRDAVKPAEFAYFLRPSSQERLSSDAKGMLEATTDLFDRMKADVPHLAPTRANPLSNTIYFRHPGEKLVEKYSLATMQLDAHGKTELYAHVVVMPHATRDVLSEFLGDLRRIT